ncbi:MAG: cyclase family protein [Candidatus Dadabacteria bacterium]|nr:cyclase family protein [Candidatus Dadabacteria bacterium]
MMFKLALMLLAAAVSHPAFAFDTSKYRLIDLSHTYNEKTLYWPTTKTGFERKSLHHGRAEGGYFYSSGSFCTAEHGGTHMDAPVHFARRGMAAHRIPLRNLIAPGVVIDVSKKAAADRNYRLTAEDVLEFERKHGKIKPGTIVIMKTGWERYWPDAKKYFGDDTPGDASNLSFPSYGESAARLLVEKRRVSVIGVDTASLDYGPSKDFIVHRIAGARNVAGLENLKSLDKLPPKGFTVIALPMKIEGGSGGPARVVAVVPK